MESATTTESLESMEKSETFWLGYRDGSQAFQSFPISFRLTGSYGSYVPNAGSGVVANRYMYSNNEAALAGSGYASNPFTRLYGGNGGASWSGWGNGKWGHYGKG